jgi:hypothetical protein
MSILGPRSISGVLKILFDILFALVSLGLIAMGVYALLSALAMANPQPFTAWRWSNGWPVLAQSARAATAVPIITFNMLGALAILSLLRKLFGALVQGKPFTAENARRLRIMGLVLAALELSHYGVWWLLVSNHLGRFARPDLDITGLIGIGVLFGLAEFFDEGVRMKRDLDLTI